MGSEGESDITQISFSFQGLSISVTKSRAPAPLVNPNPEAPPSESGVGSTPDPRTLSPEPVQSAGSAPLASSLGSSSCGPPGLSSPEAAASSCAVPEEEPFPEVPSAWLLAAKVLRAKGFSGEARVRRAWTAGCWAKAVLQGRAGVPPKTPKLDLPNKFYAVARSSNGSPPEIYSSQRDYRIAVDHLSSAVSLSQGFPSELEYRVYLDAAGIKTYLPSY